MTQPSRLACALALVCTLLACGNESTDENQIAEPTPTVVVTAPILGIQVSGLSDEWNSPSTHEDGRLAIANRAPRVGEVSVFVVEQDFGLNLYEVIKDHGRTISSRPDGTYQGAQELVGVALGTAFYSRGSFTDDAGQSIEETTIFTLTHGARNVLAVQYRYPAGDDSAERVQSLLELLEVIEPLQTAAG